MEILVEASKRRPGAGGGMEQEILARLRAAPDNVSILLELQTYYNEHARYEEEVAILRQLLELELSAEEHAETLHDLVHALYRQGSVEEAMAQAEDLITAYPDYRHLGSVYWFLGTMYTDRANWSEYRDTTWQQDVEAAKRNLRIALNYVEDKQERAGVLVELGAALSISAELVEAQRAFEQALNSGIEDPVTLTTCYERLGRVLYRQDQIEQATQYCEKAVLVCPEQPSNSRALAYVDLARICREQGDSERAEQHCEQARQVLDKRNPREESLVLGSIYEELGDISFEKAEYQRAADNYKAALGQVQLPEEKDELYYKLMVALRWDGQYEQALEAMREALTLALSSQPINEEHVGELLFHMGDCAYGLHDYHQAIMLLEKATEKVNLPVLAEAHLLLGHSYFGLGRFGEAAECYRKAIAQTKFLSPSWRQAVRYYVWARKAR